MILPSRSHTALAKSLGMLVSAAGIEPATHALKELVLPVFPTTSRLLRDCQTLENTTKAD
jgi:hypothetical protein